jgi:8-oxo-dGTP pyrophosphatase MutT (NUDIX family)
MRLKELIHQLEKRMKEPLPGPAAQMLMAPQPLQSDRFQIIARPNARIGSVLVLFYPDNQRALIPLILRPKYDGAHGGQVSFPGGKFEEGDTSIIQTALREASEEVGILPEHVNVIGTLSKLYIPPSNFSVTPVVAFTERQPQFKINYREVAKLLNIPFSVFLDESLRKEKQISSKGLSMRTPYFHIEDYVIWGATAMMISELIELVKR